MTDILVVYWTGTGNTEIMAEKIILGINKSGVSATLQSVEQVNYDEIGSYKKIAFGCPSMGIEELEEEDFEPFFSRIEPMIKDLKIALFGSYGWGAGEWMDDWVARSKKHGAIVFQDEGLIINSTPDTDDEKKCVDFGAEFALF